ncbi:MAG TPA: sigma-70 family RNA polymerase sigma factor [Acidimicrobiales bacterium]|nr:sigma-70 family RNA polymerase sigma factor [Acidimicrobiales bacterium]
MEAPPAEVRPDDEGLLASYLADIAQYPPLSPAQERELVRVIRTAPEPEASMSRRRLIQANLERVVSIAEQYRWAHLPFLDLIMEGNLGLMRAVERYDPAKPSSFGAIAAWHARQVIQRAIGRFPAGAVG